MTIPTLQANAGIYLLRWEQEGILIRIDHIQDNSHSLTGEFTIRVARQDMDMHLQHGTMNLLAPRTRKSWAKDLSTRLDDVNWDDILEQACVLTIRKHREGEPLYYVGNEPQCPARQRFLLYPFLVQSQPNVIYGEGGSAKSTFAALLALLVRTGYRISGLEASGQGNVLYLDYESCKEDVNDQVAALKLGNNIEETHDIAYRFCAQPLVDDIAEIQRLVIETEARLVIVDSVGYACGSTTHDPKDPVMRYFQALRTLRVTTLSIDHVSKERPEEAYGSIYKFNSARNLWQVKKSYEPGSDEMALGFYHRKINRGQLCKPYGYMLRFENEGQSISVEQTDLLSIPELAAAIKTKTRIAEVLKSGAKPVSEIARELDLAEASIRQALNRQKGKLFIKLGENWGLLAKEAI